MDPALSGVAHVAAVVVLVWLTVGGLTSLWCVWAAVTSVAIDLFLRDEERHLDIVATLKLNRSRHTCRVRKITHPDLPGGAGEDRVSRARAVIGCTGAKGSR